VPADPNEIRQKYNVKFMLILSTDIKKTKHDKSIEDGQSDTDL